MHLNCAPTAEQYNSVKHFDNQVRDVETGLLQSIGKLFVKHDLNSRFGIGLLHRHFHLKPKQIMLHSRRSDNIEMCNMVSLDSCSSIETTPKSFYLNPDGVFQPFEYCQSPVYHPPPSSFLQDLRMILYKHSLQNVLCLSVGGPSEFFWEEYLQKDGDGTISYARTLNQNTSRNGIVTNWVILVEAGEVVVTAQQWCDPRPKGGGHLVKDS